MSKLKTTYLGLNLNSPIVVSAGPLCKEIGNIKKMEDAGAGAVVLHSLFEEQINLESNELDQFLAQGSDVSPEAMAMFPDMGSYNIGPDAYLEHIRKAKAAVKVPVIASLNGVSNGGWIRYAKLMEEAGADALELNIYYLPTSSELTGAEVEETYCDLVANVNTTVRIPLAVKIAPYFSSMANVARNLNSPEPTRWCSSTGSTSRISTSTTWKLFRRSNSAGRTNCACACTGRPCSAATSRPTSPSRVASTQPKTLSRA
jgi:dihydroorotate dehydrogenase (fumarate)